MGEFYLDPGVKSLKSGVKIWGMIFDLGFKIKIFKEQYLGSDLWNEIHSSIQIQIFTLKVFRL